MRRLAVDRVGWPPDDFGSDPLIGDDVADAKLEREDELLGRPEPVNGMGEGNVCGPRF